MRLLIVLSALSVLLTCSGDSAPRCLPSNCNGCCADDGVCVQTPSSVACGSGGRACAVCSAEEACTGGVCFLRNEPNGGSGGGEEEEEEEEEKDGGAGAGGGESGGGDGGTGGGGGQSGGGAGGGSAGSGGALVINELDYDTPGTDTEEFIELYNGTGASISLAGYTLVLVNGNNHAAYQTISLSPVGSLGPQEFLVIAGQATLDTISTGAKQLAVTPSASGFIQNGNPDGVALLDSVGTLIDSVSYGGETLLNGVSLIEGGGDTTGLTDTDSAGTSIARVPNGVDINNTSADWVRTTRTPGAPNL